MRCWRAAGLARHVLGRAAALRPDAAGCPTRGCARGWRRWIRWTRAALAEALAGNISAHIVYCVRADEQTERANFMANDAVPVTRELSGTEIAGGVRPDGTITLVYDGLRVPLALPALAPAILRLVDGRRSVSEITAVLAEHGTGAEAFAGAWRATFGTLERINRLLLAAPGS